jgi:hypothetical protein
MGDWGFGRKAPPSCIQPCQSPCKLAKDGDDKLSDAAAVRIEALTRKPVQKTGIPPATPASSLMPSDASGCEKWAPTMVPTLCRFNRYREALPYARSALDMNKLGDNPKPPKKDEPPQPNAKCLTRLPVTADALCKELGLRAGTIKEVDLRNDETGFRAAMYRDESTGKLILVGRDTQPTSLADWQTNTRNGDGKDTPQYVAMRKLSGALADRNIAFDMAGYSKGGGLAQEVGLMNTSGKIFVFNSAGLPLESLKRTGSADFNALAGNTTAFSSENDFLTYMNDTTDPTQQIANVQFLRRELAGGNRKFVNPMKIDHSNPASDGKADSGFANELNAYMHELDAKIAAMERDNLAGIPIQAFPPVRAVQKETISNSMGTVGKMSGAGNAGPNLGKLAQHQMENVSDGLQDNVDKDRKALENFVKFCG